MIPVYDSINKDLLLGYHPRWAGGEPYRRFMVGTYMSVPCSPAVMPEEAVTSRTVEFQRGYKYSDSGRPRRR